MPFIDAKITTALTPEKKEKIKSMTGLVCDILKKELGIPGSAVYVTYHPITDWGWNGHDF